MNPLRRLAGPAAVVLAATAVLWSLLSPPASATLDQQVAEVAESMRCPTCGGESAADSAAANARAMRALIRERLAAGEDPDEVRAYFVERYGRWILLDPPARGADVVLWLAPLAAGGVAAGVAARALGRGRRATPAGVLATASPSAPGARPHRRRVLLGGAALGLVAVSGAVAVAGAHETPRAVGGVASPPSPVGADAEPRTRATRSPAEDAGAAFRLGFALARAGEDAEAERVLAELVRRHPTHREGLLLLGTTERALGRAQWRDTLQRFLAEAPDHPGAPVVRRLLGQAP